MSTGLENKQLICVCPQLYEKWCYNTRHGCTGDKCQWGNVCGNARNNADYN